MLRELQTVHEKFVEAMKREEGVMGAWIFGSVGRGGSDEYSDIDAVFLVEESAFSALDRKREALLRSVCDEVLLEYAEGFNGEAIKNYGFLLQLNDRIFQYDLFLLNRARLDDYICKLHYTDLREEQVLFDRGGAVRKLIGLAHGEPWRDDPRRLIADYWYHAHMTAKYLIREDFFKLEAVTRVLYDTHASLLLTALDELPWGGSANKLSHIDGEKQRHLTQYGCTADFREMTEKLRRSMEWFIEDSETLSAEAEYARHVGEAVRAQWEKILSER